jgi:energy-coupling factor transporter ATP-binding protein EcfA2
MTLNIPQNYSVYETTYGTDVPLEQLYAHNYNNLPSKFSENKKYDIGIFNFLNNSSYVEINRITNRRRHDDVFKYLFINSDKKMFICLSHNKLEDKTDNLNLEFYYDITLGELETQFNFEEIKQFEKPYKKAQINLIKSEMGHLDTQEYDLAVPDMDLELNYGSEFKKVHDVIIDRLNKENDKGIILLHGDPGTGKTSYIKYLTKVIKDKEILFIPPSMAEMLSEPSIIPFLMDHRNTILIIEDAERVISDRQINGSAAGVSNLLNLTDGILGDCLNIQVIATFNMKREKIDQALLRKGRLIAEHKFEKLNVDDTNRLLKHINKNVTVKEGLVLADIYNIDVEEFKSSNKNLKIGF